MFCDVEHIVVICELLPTVSKGVGWINRFQFDVKPHLGTSSSFTGVWEDGNDNISVDLCQQLAYDDM